MIQCAIIVGQPFDSGLENRLSLFNEFMTSIYLYIMISFTDYSGTNILKTQLAWGLISVILFTLFVNMAKLLNAVWI